MRKIWCELFAVVVANWQGVFRRSGLSRVAGGGSVGPPDSRQFVGHGAGGGLHRIALAAGRLFSWTDLLVGAGCASEHDAER